MRPRILIAILLLTACSKLPVDPTPVPEDENVLEDEEILSMVRTDVPNTAYYKDLFLDGGANLNPGVKINGEVANGEIPQAVKRLGYSCEYFLSTHDDPFANAASSDVELQREIICGKDFDHNGVLLYPDGEPRFRMIFVYGGQSTKHGNSLGVEGRSRVHDFYSHGGSYVGSCAGAYLAGQYASGTKSPYFNIWPEGNVIATGLSGSKTGIQIVKDSPLLDYFDFGGDKYVDGVRHNGGGYMDTETAPAGTEVLALFGTDPSGSQKTKFYGKPNIWAYKASERTGRVVVSGSHPEDGREGEILDLTTSLFMYADAGHGCAKVKGVLHNGEKRFMDDILGYEPDYGAIGDLQCHHFVVYLPSPKSRLNITLTGKEGYDLQLYVKKDNFAFPENEPDCQAVAPASSQTVSIDSPGAGIWYVTVRCASTVESTLTVTDKSTGKGRRFVYSGNTEVLEGVPYTIVADWK